MQKVKVHPDYPPEEDRYLRGNDFSPVAVAIILNCDADKTSESASAPSIKRARPSLLVSNGYFQ